MKSFVAFTKKEWMENVRTYRIYILGAVFLLMGILNPLTALLLPELIGGMDLGGIIIDLPEPTAMDSWAQFFSNITLGMTALVISYCGIIANEISRGTLVNLLTKGMKRQTVIWSKFFISAAIWTGIYLLCLGVTYAYTAFYWSGSGMDHVVITFLSPWLVGVFLIALLIFGGVLTGTFSGTLLVSGGVVVVLNLINLVPVVGRFNPMTLANGTFALLDSSAVVSDFLPAIYVSIIAIVSLLLISILVFNKKRI